MKTNNNNILFLSLIIVTTLSCISCKKDDNTKTEEEVNNTTITNTFIENEWTQIDSILSSTFDYITDIEEDENGFVYVCSYNTSSKNSKISKININQEYTAFIDTSTSDYFISKVTSIGIKSTNDIYLGAQFFDEASITKKIIKFNNNEFVSYIAPGGTVYGFEDFYFDNNGLWYGSGNSGLVNFNNSTFIEYNSFNSEVLYPNYIYNIVSYNDGFIFNTSNSLMAKNSNGFEVILSSITNNAMDIDLQDNIWIINIISDLHNRYELIKYNGQDTIIFNMPAQPDSYPFISDLEVDNDNNIWIATTGSNGQGLFKFDGVNWTIFTTENSNIQSLYLTKLKSDIYGNLWVGSEDKGVIILNNN